MLCGPKSRDECHAVRIFWVPITSGNDTPMLPEWQCQRVFGCQLPMATTRPMPPKSASKMAVSTCLWVPITNGNDTPNASNNASKTTVSTCLWVAITNGPIRARYCNSPYYPRIDFGGPEPPFRRQNPALYLSFWRSTPILTCNLRG